VSTDQEKKAFQFRALQRASQPLVVANAWDAASARIFEEAEFPAIATTSAGIAFSQGYPDGERIPLAHMLETVARICKVVAVPVTADMESGYGNAPEAVERTTTGVIEAGAVGMNLEDGTRNPEKPLADLPLQLEKLKAVKEASKRAGVSIVLNARTDAYLRHTGSAREQFEEALRRAKLYRDAGADCIFVPGLSDKTLISEIVRELDHPINILVTDASPTIAELKGLGVARVTFGSGPMRATLKLLQQMANEILKEGTYSMLECTVSHAKMNDLMR
jgi:2-methylisocitrate lyase-like PEP mutase family enzyme